MGEATYRMPEDGSGAGSAPEPSGEGQRATRAGEDALEEMNAKLDAILEALGVSES